MLAKVANSTLANCEIANHVKNLIQISDQKVFTIFSTYLYIVEPVLRITCMEGHFSTYKDYLNFFQISSLCTNPLV